MVPVRAVVFGSFAVVLSANVLAQTAVPAVRLRPVQQVRKGVDAWPLIADADTPVALRINTALTLMNTRLLMALRACDAESAGTSQDADTDWVRAVRVTMSGPQYLSLVAKDETSCGGVSAQDVLALVFDLSSGELVKPLSLMSKSMGASAVSSAALDGSPLRALTFPALKKVYVEAAAADCKTLFDDQQAQFLLWPDAKRGTLAVVALDLQGAARPCAVPLQLSMEQAAVLGFREELLAAIAAAHSVDGGQH